MKPGQKLCTNCLKRFESQKEDIDDIDIKKSILNVNANLFGISHLKRMLLDMESKRLRNLKPVSQVLLL